jgi:hypothetical protein
MRTDNTFRLNAVLERNTVGHKKDDGWMSGIRISRRLETSFGRQEPGVGLQDEVFQNPRS